MFYVVFQSPHENKSVIEPSFILASDSELVLVSSDNLMKSLTLCNLMGKLLGHVVASFYSFQFGKDSRVPVQ